MCPTTRRAPFRNPCRRGGCSSRVSDLRVINSAQTPFALDLSHCPDSNTPAWAFALSATSWRYFTHQCPNSLIPKSCKGRQGSPAPCLPARSLCVHYVDLLPHLGSRPRERARALLWCSNPFIFAPGSLWYLVVAPASQFRRSPGTKRRSLSFLTGIHFLPFPTRL